MLGLKSLSDFLEFDSKSSITNHPYCLIIWVRCFSYSPSLNLLHSRHCACAFFGLNLATITLRLTQCPQSISDQCSFLPHVQQFARPVWLSASRLRMYMLNSLSALAKATLNLPISYFSKFFNIVSVRYIESPVQFLVVLLDNVRTIF